mgnify:CR=1 FL=1
MNKKGVFLGNRKQHLHLGRIHFYLFVLVFKQNKQTNKNRQTITNKKKDDNMWWWWSVVGLIITKTKKKRNRIPMEESRSHYHQMHKHKG